MKKNIFKNRIFLFSLLAVVLFFSFFSPQIVFANVQGAIAKTLGWILFPFISLLGRLAYMLLGQLIKVAQYSDFIHSSVIENGWSMVRDLCNMFFILILLLLAFASILRIDSYNLKTWLPKLVIMAVLINFSKLICGVLIDFAQVVMLTFVNAFKDMAGGNLTHMLGLTEILQYDSDAGVATVVQGLLFGLIFLIVACMVMFSMLLMLVIRTIMIWIYVVLSPLAYLLASFPQGQSYSQKWWSDFSKNLIIGPVLAFFIWLSFASLGQGSADIEKMTPETEMEGESSYVKFGEKESAVAEASNKVGSGIMIRMIISVGMLYGGMTLAQEMGGQAGKVIGKGTARIAALGAGALAVGNKTGKRTLGLAAEKTLGLTGKGLGAVSGGTLGGTLRAWSKDMKKERGKKSSQFRQDIARKIGMGENAAAAGSKITGKIKEALNVGDRRGRREIETGKTIREEGGGAIERGQEMVDEGKREITAGETMKHEGEISLKLAQDLEVSQNNYKNLESRLALMSATDPNRANVQDQLDDEAETLEELKVRAGLDKHANDTRTNNRINELKQEEVTKTRDGDALITRGNLKVSTGEDTIRTGMDLQEEGADLEKEGRRKIDRESGKFGTFLIGNTNDAFEKIGKDAVDARKFVSSMAEGGFDFSQLESSEFSGLGGKLNSKQKKTWEGLNEDNLATANLLDSLKSKFYDKNGQAKSLGSADKTKVNALARGLRTYQGSGANLSTEMSKIKDLIDKYSRDSGSEIKTVDSHSVGSYRLGSSSREAEEADTLDKEDDKKGGLGSINQYGRKGLSGQEETLQGDTISYSFDDLKSQGIDINPKAYGVYFEDGDIKEQIKVEVIAAVDKELTDLNSQADLSPQDQRRKDVLENTKTRLENNDNFTLVNKDKQMPLSEAVISMRHEEVHKEVNVLREERGIEASEDYRQQEESLVEHYGEEAREARLTGREASEADKEVAKIIVAGQENGLSVEDIMKAITRAVNPQSEDRVNQAIAAEEELNLADLSIRADQVNIEGGSKSGGKREGSGDETGGDFDTNEGFEDEESKSDDKSEDNKDKGKKEDDPVLKAVKKGEKRAEGIQTGIKNIRGGQKKLGNLAELEANKAFIRHNKILGRLNRKNKK